jgi:alcohol dehydrogenase
MRSWPGMETGTAIRPRRGPVDRDDSVCLLYGHDFERRFFPMDFAFTLPIKIVFGRNKLERIPDICHESNLETGLLVSDPVFVKIGLADRVLSLSKGCLKGIFSGLSPNPDVEEVDRCAEMIRKIGAGFLVALGGGSSMDCAKAASVIAGSGKPARHFHSEKGAVPGPAFR